MITATVRGQLPDTASVAPGPGLGPARLVSMAGRRALRLDCRFSTSAIERAYWDITVDWDMRQAAGVELLLACSDPSPVSQFNVYLHAKGTWHAAGVAPTKVGDWTALTVHKAATSPEGVSRGWGRVDKVRIAAWRGGSRDTVLYLAGLAVLAPNTNAAILRCLSTVPPAERGAARRYAQGVAGAFASQGVYPACIEEVDLTPALLRGKGLLILPYHPDLPELIAQRLAAFVRDGGKLMGFYNLPKELSEVLGIRTGDYVRSSSISGGVGGMVFREGIIAGMPTSFRQDSANFLDVVPSGHGARPVGWWYSHDGKNTGHCALVVSSRGAWFGHVYLGRDSARGAQALTAVAGHFLPGLWRQAAEGKLEALTQGISNGPPEPTLRLLKQRGTGHPRARERFDRAEVSYRAARRLFETGQYAQCIDFAEACREQMIQGLLLMQAPKGREVRAVWCHRSYGIDGWSWEKSAGQLAASGFNTLIVNVADAARADYRSALLPAGAALAEKGDQLQAALAACRPRGIRVHAWKICFDLRGDAGRTAYFAKLGRLQRTRGGRTRGWLCPSHIENRMLEAQVAAEMARNYPGLAGVHLDFIRFPGSDSCFCPQCRRGFEAQIGRPVGNWPAAVSTDKSLREGWLAYRRSVITDVVRRVEAAVRDVRPGCYVSAAVFSDWTTARDRVAQDWLTWAKAGYVDFLCPMNYHRDARAFQSDVVRQADLLRGGRTALLPGIGLSSGKLDALETMRQINVTRRIGTQGFVLFEYNRREALDVLPTLAPAMGRPGS